MADIIFLDIDGVLNSTESLLRADKDTPTTLEMEFLLKLSSSYYKGYPLGVLTTDLLGLKTECVANLNTILEASEASVVVSSSWRFCHTIRGLQKLLEFRGFRGRLIGSTPVNLIGMPRGVEIQTWMDLNPEVKRIVILDDNADMAHLRRFLVQTNEKKGLTRANAMRAISIIKPDSAKV